MQQIITKIRNNLINTRRIPSIPYNRVNTKLIKQHYNNRLKKPENTIFHLIYNKKSLIISKVLHISSLPQYTPQKSVICKAVTLPYGHFFCVSFFIHIFAFDIKITKT